LEPFEMGLKHDMVRGFKRRNFWVMETQPGFVQWSPLNNPLDRGEVRAMAWHLCAHGADAVLYWQWRSALGGQEQLHGTIVGPSGRPRPLYQEIVQTGQEFRRLATLLDGTAPRARVALVWTFESRDALLGQKHHREFDPTAHLLAYYRALRAAGLNVDVIHAGVPLEGYALVVAPHLYLLDDALANHLLNYVRGGGRLWLGLRTGMKDRHNALLPALQPGQVLGPALGAHVEEFYALEEPVPVSGPLGAGTAAIFAEWLAVEASDTEVLLRYSGHSWLDGQPAFVTRPCEKGRLSYLAAWLDAPLMQRAVAWALRDVPLPRPPVAELPQGVEYASRSGTGCELCFFINHTREARTLRLTETLDDAFTMQRTRDELVLPPRGVAVLVKL
jgi:beta-galactosidase